MRKSAFLFATVFLALASFAHADMSGAYAGKITMTQSNGDSQTLTEFQIAISQDDKSITFADPVGITQLDSVVFLIDGGKLMLNGAQVGTITADTVTVTLVDQFKEIYDQITLHKNADGSLTYTEHMADYNGHSIDSVANAPAAKADASSSAVHAPRGARMNQRFQNLLSK